MAPHSRRAFSKAELLVTIVVGAVSLAVISVALGGASDEQPASARTSSKRIKDATQIRGIHQSWIVYGNEFKGLFPRPGLINRLAFNGQQIPGRGPEDTAANTTANLYSCLVMGNYIPPEILISPVERNPKVKGCTEFNYEAYDVAKDEYWDLNFKADLDELSRVSYAHMPLHGARLEKQWRDTLDPNFAIVGNRGPKDGLMDSSSVTCGPHGNWAGNICFNDNHSQFLSTTIWKFIVGGADKSDNLFATEADLDMILAFTRKFTDQGPELQFD